MAPSVEAKKVELTKWGRKALRDSGPRVQQAEEDLCLYKNEDDFWCYKGESPILRVGIDWEQVFGQDTTLGADNTNAIDYYRLEVLPYADMQLFIDQVTNMESLFANTLAFEISNFRVNLFLSLILTDTRKYCLGFGWENEEILFEIKSTTTMQDCYKKMIDSWCDRSATVSGRNAKYLDECDASQYVTAEVYKYIYREANVS
jgi:hypothetical protein